LNDVLQDNRKIIEKLSLNNFTINKTNTCGLLVGQPKYIFYNTLCLLNLKYLIYYNSHGANFLFISMFLILYQFIIRFIPIVVIVSN